MRAAHEESAELLHGAAEQAPRTRLHAYVAQNDAVHQPRQRVKGVAAWGSAAAASAASSERRAAAATPVTTGADRITTPDVTADAMDSGVSWRDRPAGHERRKSRGRPQVCRGGGGRRGGAAWRWGGGGLRWVAPAGVKPEWSVFA